MGGLLSAHLDGDLILLHEPRWANQEDWLRTASREQRLRAPCCHAPLILKWGSRKVRHFAHPPRVSCPFDRYSEPESPEHMAGKIMLYDWCRRQLGDAIAELALEYPLRETLQRPDVYLVLKSGERHAIEYQRAAISPGQWAERHTAYQSQGIHDIWILGENRLADALPSPEQQARWSAREPFMQFLDLRAFENAASVHTSYEIAWWRGDQQEELWRDQELDARAHREVSPWYGRSTLSRLRSISFLDAVSGELSIYRAMRELRGHVDTRMASAVLRQPLSAPDLTLTPEGFVTAADRDRRQRHEDRVRRLEELLAARVEDVTPPVPPAPVSTVPPLPAGWPSYFHQQAERRAQLVARTGADPARFLLGAQEAEQRRRLEGRAQAEAWRKLVDRYGLSKESLFYLIGVPLADDTIISTHRTVWQAFLTFRILGGLSRGFPVQWAVNLLIRTFGLDAEMVRVAKYILPGQVNDPAQVVGAYLNLLVSGGYLRNDMGSELFYYHPVAQLPPPVAFADRKDRFLAWAGLLAGTRRREGEALVSDVGEPAIPLMPVFLSDRPTPAQVAAIPDLDPTQMTFRQASQLISQALSPGRGYP